MERIIQPYSPTGGAPAPQRPGAIAIPAPPAGPPAKSPADFARAVRRRAWIALGVALLVAAPAAVLVLRQPDQYRVVGQVLIEPPQFNARLGAFLPEGSVGRSEPGIAEKYVPNRLLRLRSRGLADKAVASPSVALPPDTPGDPAAELAARVQTRPYTGTTTFDVILEGTDPGRTTRLLAALLEEFKLEAHNDAYGSIDDDKIQAKASLNKMRTDLEEVNKNILTLLNETPIFMPDGRSLLQDKYASISAQLAHSQARHAALLQEANLRELNPAARPVVPPTREQQRIAAQLEQLWQDREMLAERAVEYRRGMRNYGSDPATLRLNHKLRGIDGRIDALEAKARAIPAPPDMTSLVLAQSGGEVRRMQEAVNSLLAEMREQMPQYQAYQRLLSDRAQREADITAMQKKLDAFEALSQSHNEPVTILQMPVEPTAPTGPNRALNLVLVIALGLAAGVGLVVLLEYLDHKVRVPEQLTAGLTLPLLGVVPRIRRLARTQRGGHIWTPGAPASLEADAYRNLRASLVGTAGADGRPIVTLLVTSAKAGEGKSTTALNLAATCARAGERTLLVDVDLRRPSLAEVFDPPAEADPDDLPRLGLVDVLREDIPWQRAVARTDIPNLDFLPAGDPAGVPVEVLGSMEMRQLLAALAGRYHRVILDGPAVLGMADCRVLGRAADAALFVVRSGAHELRPLQRAKTMLEQSRVHLAGVVFNGLNDDLDNWSSYGVLPDAGPEVAPAPALTQT